MNKKHIKMKKKIHLKMTNTSDFRSQKKLSAGTFHMEAPIVALTVLWYFETKKYSQTHIFRHNIPVHPWEFICGHNLMGHTQATIGIILSS